MRLVLLPLLAVAGCMTHSFDLGAPRSTLAGSPRDRCYQAERLEVVEGSASWTENMGGGTYVSANAIAIGPDRIDFHARSGAVFYRGGARLAPLDALALLPDRALRDDYADHLASRRRKARLYRPSLYAAFGMLGAGVALLGVGFYAHERDERGATPLYTGIGLVGGALIPTVVALVVRRSWNLYQVEQRIYTDAGGAPALAAAVEAHNAGVAARCDAS
jgi:hypothetical protein